MISNYLSEIKGVGWMYEVIAENFSNALDMISHDSLVYGGAVRDCLANKPLLGDLDIISPFGKSGLLIEAFSKSTKWILLNDGGGGSEAYKKQLMVGKVYSFKGVDGKNVQIVVNNNKYSDRKLDSCIETVRTVDIICCGVIMMNDGRIFEVIPGAYNDCLSGTLNLNKRKKDIDVAQLETRVSKLVERGWKSNIDMDRLKKRVVTENKKPAFQTSLTVQQLSKFKVMNTDNHYGTELVFNYSLDRDFKQLKVTRTLHNIYVNTPYGRDINEWLKRIAQKFTINMRVFQDPLMGLMFAVEREDYADAVIADLERFVALDRGGKIMSKTARY
jgi:hypothetical protein